MFWKKNKKNQKKTGRQSNNFVQEIQFKKKTYTLFSNSFISAYQRNVRLRFTRLNYVRAFFLPLFWKYIRIPSS